MAFFGSFGQCLTKNITVYLIFFQLAENENIVVVSWTCVLIAARDYSLQLFGKDCLEIVSKNLQYTVIEHHRIFVLDGLRGNLVAGCKVKFQRNLHREEVCRQRYTIAAVCVVLSDFSNLLKTEGYIVINGNRDNLLEHCLYAVLVYGMISDGGVHIHRGT